MSRAIVTGVTGQDGSYLAEFLLDKGYEVIGVVRRSATEDLSRITGVIENPKFTMIPGDITEPHFISEVISTLKPDEFYNLAAQSFVGYSFENPVSTFEVNATAVIHMLSAIEKRSPKTKFYQASTSEMYGGFTDTAPQNELTYFKPQSPYGVAKLAAHNVVRLARDRGIFACSGILFNHESERRGKEFVTQKIVEQCVEIWAGKRDKIKMGWLGAQRDWGYAPEYVQGMWKMLQHPVAGDYVLATNTTYTVQQFLEWTCEALGLEWEKIYENDPRFMRPNEVKLLKGDPNKAMNELNWKPQIHGKALAIKMLAGALNRYPLGEAKMLADRLLVKEFVDAPA